MAKGDGVRRSRVNGIIAECHDGRIWTWSVGLCRYRWCLLGHLEVIGLDRVQRIAFMRTIHAAIAYTLGLADGVAESRRLIAGLKTDYKADETTE